jgi:transposase
MKKSKAYRAVDVKNVNWRHVLEGRVGQEAQMGLDIGKEQIFCALRWGSSDFEHPWRVRNPDEVRLLAERLSWLSEGRRLLVAMEPTGTYGDPLRQALAEANVPTHRVSPKMASDFAEIFDGVPSQHDGKDAGVVAELAAQGRCWPWMWSQGSDADQEMEYWVDWLDAQRRQMMMWLGRLEALISRHWPEATRLMRLRSAVLLEVLKHYGGPAALANDGEGLRRVRGWGRAFLTDDKARALVASAGTTVGVKQGRWDQQRLQTYAGEVLACLQQRRQGLRRLQVLAKGNPVIERQADIVGTATACVLWVYLGDPREYHCGGAYRKAMGLNLAERSSGKYAGQVKISKRGPAMVRRWLYLAALREMRREPARSWYLRQKEARRGEGKPAVIAVMRKLAMALHQVGGRGQRFEAAKLFDAVEA